MPAPPRPALPQCLRTGSRATGFLFSVFPVHRPWRVPRRLLLPPLPPKSHRPPVPPVSSSPAPPSAFPGIRRPLSPWGFFLKRTWALWVQAASRPRPCRPFLPWKPLPAWSWRRASSFVPIPENPKERMFRSTFPGKPRRNPSPWRVPKPVANACISPSKPTPSRPWRGWPRPWPSILIPAPNPWLGSRF